jgi:hypothetical protein
MSEDSKLPLWLRGSPADGALAVGSRSAWGFPFQQCRLARLGAGIRVQTHLVFGKSHCGRLIAIATPLQQSPA